MLTSDMERGVRSVLHVSDIHIALDERCSEVIQAILFCNRID